jgi:hypothetical protein
VAELAVGVEGEFAAGEGVVAAKDADEAVAEELFGAEPGAGRRERRSEDELYLSGVEMGELLVGLDEEVGARGGAGELAGELGSEGAGGVVAGADLEGALAAPWVERGREL